jgi:hypothetical protein
LSPQEKTCYAGQELVENVAGLLFPNNIWNICSKQEVGDGDSKVFPHLCEEALSRLMAVSGNTQVYFFCMTRSMYDIEA